MKTEYTFDEGALLGADLADAMDDILRELGQRVGRLAQTPKAKGGRMPVDNGDLRGSFVAGVNGFQFEGPEVAEFSFASAKAGDTIYMGWTADHALRLNSGFVGEDSLGRTYNQEGNFFADKAAEAAPGIMDDIIAEIFG